MAQRRPLSGNSKRSPRRRLADGLAQLRAEAGLSLRELAEKTGWDHGHLSKMEQGKALGGPELVEALDSVYGTSPLLVDLWELARDGGPFRDKYQRYMQLEDEALAIEEYHGQTISGFLQTEAYARTLLWSTPHGPADVDQLEEQLSARLSRQEILRREPAPYLRTILDEAALRRPLRDVADWGAQLRRLVDAASEPLVVLQVLPNSVGLHDLLGGSTTLLRLPDGRAAAWQESSKNGELAEGSAEVEQMRVSYDAVRDLALSPRDSLAFVEQLMEGLACDLPAPT